MHTNKCHKTTKESLYGISITQEKMKLIKQLMHLRCTKTFIIVIHCQMACTVESLFSCHLNYTARKLPTVYSNTSVKNGHLWQAASFGALYMAT